VREWAVLVGGNSAKNARSACVYTTVIGGYEPLNEQPVAASSRVPFICLTDDPNLASDSWQIRHVTPLFGMDPVRSQRALKLHPHEYLKDFDCSLYIDNSVRLKIEPEAVIDQNLSASGFCLPPHSFRETVLDEFMEVDALGLDEPARCFEQLHHYTIEFPEVLQEKPFWTGILLRDHRNAKVRAMLELWWTHVQRYSRRDQLSINVAFARAGFQPDLLGIDNFDSWLHTWPHNVQRKMQPPATWPSALNHPLSRARQLELEIEQHEQAIEQLTKDKEALKASIKELEKTLVASRRDTERVLSSTSWRLTAPLRDAVALAQSARGGLTKIISQRGQLGASKSAKAKKAKPLRAITAASIHAAPGAELKSSFMRDGFIGPVDVFTPAQCRLMLKHYRLGTRRGQGKWPKDYATKDRFFYDIATRPQLLALLKPLLGDDIVLWGASIVERTPGQTHVWHTDIESSAPEGGFVSVWVGLEETSRDSALQLISRSHEFGKPIQQEVHERKFNRGDATDDTIVAWAREHDSMASIVQPDMSDGQALLFDGRLWHASHNSGKRTRAALLLQFAAADRPITIPEYNQVEWPFRFTSKSPPMVAAAGRANGQTLPPPPACPPGSKPITTHVHCGEGFEESADGWIPYPLLHGPTPILAAMESHVSVLSPGRCPHPPHCHVEEELLIILSGEAEILIANGPDPATAKVERLGPGGFVYYPAYQYHTIRNASSAPVTYLMFKWQGAPDEVERPMATGLFDIGGIAAPASDKDQSMRLLFEQPTAYLEKLHAHVTDMQPGAGYPSHTDEHEVAIVVFSGTVETLGKTVGPGGSIYYAAGQPHGMRNAGNEPARYLVFEFHGPKRVKMQAPKERSASASLQPVA
jgi:uncharacterized cupin superfamily protein